MTARAKLDADRTAEPLTRIVHHPPREWLDSPTADPPRRRVLAAVREAYPDAAEMATAFIRVRPSEAWEAFLYGIMIERAITSEPQTHDLTPSEAAPTKIVVTRRFADYHAAIDGTDGRKWGCGKTIDEAVGSLVRNHPGVFDAIVDLEKVPRER
jgi:hypothetical protein